MEGEALSDRPSDRRVSSDLSDNSWRLNEDVAHLHPYKEPEAGIGITNKTNKSPVKLCKYCGAQYDSKEKVCPDCNSPNSRSLNPDTRFSLTPRNVTSQSNKKVEECWNIEEDALSGAIKKHPLEMIEVPIVNVSTGEWHKETRCNSCGAAYTKIEGRAATSEEIELAKTGKISPPTQHYVGCGNEA